MSSDHRWVNIRPEDRIITGGYIYSICGTFVMKCCVANKVPYWWATTLMLLLLC